MSVDSFFNDTPRRSEFFNAKYSGTCTYHDCHKHRMIEIGDGCEYFDGQLMHMRCARAAEREADSE